MQGIVQSAERAPGIHGERLGWLAVRIGAVLAVAGAAGIGGERVASSLLPVAGFVTAAAGVLTACITGGLLLTLIIAPLVRSRAQLTVAYQAALADALHDPLTGLGNHRAFQEELDRQVEAAQRYEVPLALAIVDLDEFKQINDTGGHADGDRALAAFGRLLATSVRRPATSLPPHTSIPALVP